jgi:hypothetical protein
MISKITSYFKSIFNSTEPESRTSIMLWEDDYMLREIFSSKNIEFAKSESTRIAKFGEEHYDGNGFTDITIVDSCPFPIAKSNIAETDLINTFEIIGLPKIMDIYYAGEKKPIENSKTKVYGENLMGIFYETNDSTISNLWFANYNFKNEDKSLISKALNEIGNKFDLILVDWNSCEIIDLKKIEEIETYLEK